MDLEKRDALVAYLADGKYPENYSENEKVYYDAFQSAGKVAKPQEQRIAEAQLVIVGDAEKKNIIERTHKGIGGGHFGMNKTSEKIAERYWWPGFKGDVECFIRSCQACQIANPLTRPEVATLHPIKVNSEFGYRWCVDLVGPLSETHNENRYIAVATEYLTRFPVAKAIPNKDAATVGQFIFENVICMFGIPRILQHDQGREFCNNLSHFMCEKLQIKKAISTAYHPQTNGLTERFNQTVVTQLMKVVNEKHNDWDEHLHAILFAYRASQQASTKKSPLEMLVGARPRLPLDIDNPHPEDTDPCNDFDSALAARMKLIAEQIVKTRSEGLQNLAVAQETQKRQFDIKHQGTYYDIGDKVLKYNRRRETRQGDKVQPRFTGPFEIHEACGKGVYRLKNTETGKVLQQKVNSRDLKRFEPPPKERKDPVEEAARSISPINVDSTRENSNDPAEEGSRSTSPIKVDSTRENSKKRKIEEKEESKVKKSKADVEEPQVVEQKYEPRQFTFKPISTTWMERKCSQLQLQLKGKRRKVKGVKKSSTEYPPAGSRSIQPIIGDGNCLFRSLSHVISSSEENHLRLRNIICEQIESNASRYLEAETASEYFSRTGMQKDKAWGTDVEMRAAADLLCTPVHCYGFQVGGNAWASYQPQENTSGEEAIFLVNLCSHFEPLYKW